MELLITAKRESSERESADAAGEVADRLEAYGVQLGGGLTFGAQTVEHWRERVKREEPLKRWYDRMLEGAKRLDPDRERAAHRMIDRFFQTVPRTAKS